MSESSELVYEGAPAAVGYLAHCLREEGVAVTYDPPEGQRSAAADLHEVVVLLTAQGTGAAIAAGIAKFRQSKIGSRAKVEPKHRREKD